MSTARTMLGNACFIKPSKEVGLLLHTHRHTCMYMHMHTHTHTHRHACTHAHTYTCMHTHMHTCMHTHLHAHTHTHTHTHTQTHTHTHTHTKLDLYWNYFFCPVHLLLFLGCSFFIFIVLVFSVEGNIQEEVYIKYAQRAGHRWVIKDYV